MEPEDNSRLAKLSGQFDEHLRHIERRLNIEIANRGNHFRIIGPASAAQAGERVLRQLYDALYEMMGYEQVAKLLERNMIEVAPLAFMRGRSLNESFIILDEAQNTTVAQMKMFLTRLGFGSTAVVTGDVSQIDLPAGQLSGLKHVVRVLSDVAAVGITRFGSRDVVRHPLVQAIVDAYDAYEKKDPPE